MTDPGLCQPVASKVAFCIFAKFCESLSTVAGKESKKVLMAKFIKRWREFHQGLHPFTEQLDSFYPAMRLILPHLDKDRMSYGMKEVVLAKYYIEVLNIAKESEDAKRLLNYRSPGSAKQDAGDFASVAYIVLKDRCPEHGSLTIADVNASLDEMAQANAERKRDATKSEIQKLIRNTSALEQKWLIRIMLKEMKMGVNENSVFAVFHPDALELYNVCNSLSKVCADLHDPATKLNETEISLFTPFRPMLGQRAAIEEVEKLMGEREFYIEMKVDGERMQLHKRNEEYRYFSRGSNDYSHVFGPLTHTGTLTRHIGGCFKSGIRTCILDGEMVAYDTEADAFVLKGSNVDVKADTREGIQPCFVVFDVLMVNSENLANICLKDRLEKLDAVLNIIPGRIQMVQRKLGRTKEDVVNALNDAIDRREEGIVIKSPESVYKPSKRKGGGWLKIKPEYVHGLSDDLDLIVLGGQYGSGHRGGIISHFLLGVAVPASSPGDHPTTFQTFGKVGSGYTDQELKAICDRLNRHWRKFDPHNLPKCIEFTPGCKERPDVLIEPKHSIILQVKAAEVTYSDKYKCGYTMRFPRLEKVRDDKLWYECMNVDELQELAKVAEGRLTYRMTDGVMSLEPDKAKRRKTARVERPRTVPSHFKGADVSDVVETSTLLMNREFCVISGPPEHPKQDLERKIVEHGGTFVQNPGATTFCVIAAGTNVRLKGIISAGKVDVVYASWLLKCLSAGSWIPFQPVDMIFTTPKSKELFQQDYDRFGDSFTEPISPQKLKELLDCVRPAVSTVSPSEIADVEARYFARDSLLGLFRQFRVYAAATPADEGGSRKHQARANTPLDFARLEVEFYGATISLSLDDDVTHVLVHTSDFSNVHRIRGQIRDRYLKPHIVTENWVRDSIDCQKLLSEGPYEPP